jgi:hypothetical protein
MPEDSQKRGNDELKIQIEVKTGTKLDTLEDQIVAKLKYYCADTILSTPGNKVIVCFFTEGH